MRLLASVNIWRADRVKESQVCPIEINVFGLVLITQKPLNTQGMSRTHVKEVNVNTPGLGKEVWPNTLTFGKRAVRI